MKYFLEKVNYYHGIKHNRVERLSNKQNCDLKKNFRYIPNQRMEFKLGILNWYSSTAQEDDE